MPNDLVPTPVDLRERNYFKKASAGQNACLVANCDFRGVAELVRSHASGNLVLIVAQPKVGSKFDGIVGIETKMAAFEKMILPLGFQAAIIDERGIVMAHSNNDAHHGQSIFTEVTEANELRASLATQVADTIQLRYLGTPSRAQVAPLGLPGMGWSVLVMAPKNIVDVATVNMLLVTAFSFCLLCLLAVVAVSLWLISQRIAVALRGQPRARKQTGAAGSFGFRPDATKSEGYADVGIRTLVITSLVCPFVVLSTHVLPTTVALAVVLGIGWFTAKSFPGVGRFGIAETNLQGPATSADSWRWHLPTTFALCCLGCTGVFVVAPATVLFCGAYDHVTDNLVRAEEDHLVRALKYRPVCLRRPQLTSEGCEDVFVGGDAAGGRGSVALLRTAALSPMPYLADLLPLAGSDDLQERMRLSRAEATRPTQNASELVSERSFFSLSLRNATTSTGLLGMDLPF